MNKLIATLVIIGIVAIIFFALGPFFIINEGEQAIVTRFGAVKNTVTTAGLHIKVPVIDNVIKYPKKLMSWVGDDQEVPTSDNQKLIIIDVSARWKIVDPLLFYQSLTTEQSAFSRLDDIINSAVRTVVTNNPLDEAVRSSNFINEALPTDPAALVIDSNELSTEIMPLEAKEKVTYPTIKKGRLTLEKDMLNNASKETLQYGIELIDIVIRQIRYSEKLLPSIYERMKKERNQQAQEFRSRGEGEKDIWFGKLDNDRRTILSEAYKEAEEIKGKADAQAAGIYADAYKRYPEFAIFWRTMESYRKTMKKFDKTLTTDLDYFKYLYDKKGR